MSQILPNQAKIVVIGGGVVGTSVLYNLAKLGWEDIVLLKRRELSCGTTRHAAGLVGLLRSSYNTTRLAQYTAELFESLEEETGQPETSRNVRKSLLHDRLAAKGACFGETYGWERADRFAPDEVSPQYEYSYGRQNWFENTRAEHEAVRNNVGIFDQTSFAKLFAEGCDAEAYLNCICAIARRILDWYRRYTKRETSSCLTLARSIAMPPPPASTFSKFLSRVLIVSALTMPGMAHSTECDSGETVINFSHVTAVSGHPKGEAAAEFARRVNHQMNERFCVRVYPNSVLYDDSQALEAVIANKLQMAAPTLSQMEPYTLAFRLFDLPFLFSNIDEVTHFQNSADGQRLLRSVEAKGLTGMGYWLNGMMQMSADRPLFLPDDAKGLVFRTQRSEVLSTKFHTLGATTEQMVFNDVYHALLMGKVNGQENTWSNIYSKHFFEVQDGITETDHSYLGYVVLIGTEFWRGLSNKDRTELQKIFDEVTAAQNNMAGRLNDESRQNIVDAGGVVRVLSDLQRAAWKHSMRPVWAQYEDQIGADLLRAAQSATRE